ncbi:hypothetical protein TWF506_010401 [Arthrobotrys conoides]|uniref:Uncharacterized protein n=1 Tax=Arthrobotrys conoides TaxID=74498 RepID=A0AAN8RPT7_9PEZI
MQQNQHNVLQSSTVSAVPAPEPLPVREDGKKCTVEMFYYPPDEKILGAPYGPPHKVVYKQITTSTVYVNCPEPDCSVLIRTGRRTASYDTAPNPAHIAFKTVTYPPMTLWSPTGCLPKTAPPGIPSMRPHFVHYN